VDVGDELVRLLKEQPVKLNALYWNRHQQPTVIDFVVKIVA